MIRPLRRYHFFVWRIVAVILPILFIAALYFRPTHRVDYKRSEKDFTFEVERLTNSTAQVNIHVINPLKVASCVAYQVDATRDILLGTLDHTGKHSFNVSHINSGELRIKLMDVLHQKEIANVLLTVSKE
jgi:hypothetical protein